jgi:anti-sigma regulatory factor (Ser/Thr protein kinase)
MNVSAASTRQRQRASRSPRELSSIMPPLAALRTTASTARAHVRSTLATWEMSHLADTTEMIVNELVANAVNASTDGQSRPLYRDGRILVIEVRLCADNSRLRAEVWDQAPGVPVPRNADDNAESGRGLAMVTALSDAWDWYPSRGQPGKCVWAEISIASLPLSPRGAAATWPEMPPPCGDAAAERRLPRSAGQSLVLRC